MIDIFGLDIRGSILGLTNYMIMLHDIDTDDRMCACIYYMIGAKGGFAIIKSTFYNNIISV